MKPKVLMMTIKEYLMAALLLAVLVFGMGCPRAAQLPYTSHDTFLMMFICVEDSCAWWEIGPMPADECIEKVHELNADPDLNALKLVECETSKVVI